MNYNDIYFVCGKETENIWNLFLNFQMKTTSRRAKIMIEKKYEIYLYISSAVLLLFNKLLKVFIYL